MKYLVMILLVSCAMTPAKKTEFVNNQTYAISYDKVWESLVSFFTSNGIGIKNIDKNSGLIAAEKMSADSSFNDCGSKLDFVYSADSIQLNVFVQKISSNSNKVTINQFAKTLVPVKNLYGFTVGTNAYDCYSTGKLEKMIFESIK